MVIKHAFSVSNDFIELFNKKNYESFVLDLMNLSKTVFPNSYSMVKDQSAGQCDYIDTVSGAKFDAKLPFLQDQVYLLRRRRDHAPEIQKWIEELHYEAAEYDPFSLRDNPHYTESTKLYRIMNAQILKDKDDENIVFFLPYPISFDCTDSVFLQFATDYISMIFDELKKSIDLKLRNIYIIYPSSKRNCFALRSSENSYFREYVHYDEMEKYFYYEVVDFDVSESPNG